MTKFRIEGLKELEKTLMQLPRATRKNAMRRTLKSVGEILARDARQRAPRQNYHLQESIEVSSQASPKDVKKSEVEIYVGPSFSASQKGAVPQSITQEFGTWFHAPRPYMRPAWDSSQNKMLNELKFSVFDEVQKAVARAERKAKKG